MVRLCSDGIQGLVQQLKKKELVCFGAGGHLKTVMELYDFCHLSDQIVFIADNNPAIWGSKKHIRNREIPVVSIEQLRTYCKERPVVILVTCHMYSMEIVEQLDGDLCFENVAVYVGSFLSHCNTGKERREAIISHNGSARIPKTIHYCWFGGKDIPDAYKKYMESWTRFCPDYVIKRWDETNFDISQNKYMYQAYQHKKWAFVSDYARIKILCDQGGIYLDTDVQLLKTLEPLRYCDFYCGMEDGHHVNFGLGYGSVKGHAILVQLLKKYDHMDFVNSDGTLNLIPCVAYQTEVMSSLGFKMENRLQYKNNIFIYPTYYFAPQSPWGEGMENSDTISIHHYTASWQPQDSVIRVKEMYRLYCKRIDRQRGEK